MAGGPGSGAGVVGGPASGTGIGGGVPSPPWAAAGVARSLVKAPSVTTPSAAGNAFCSCMVVLSPAL
ncbi:hypothetical protein [Actinokineospora spheciospongiae]|uniref:hypothetical protein n=1 Tax=Actinokineospora spheciospongiae TaxID=909613 RepID=UPI0011B56919|nr:hypothetical protein [Actinokineospora spheciospongiae]